MQTNFLSPHFSPKSDKLMTQEPPLDSNQHSSQEDDCRDHVMSSASTLIVLTVTLHTCYL